MTTTRDTCVVVSAFNEERMIGTVLSDLMRSQYDVIVVDDGSFDDTRIQALRYPVKVLHHIVNMGAGATLQTGISYALSLPGIRFIVTLDGDGQHKVDDIPNLLAPLRDGTYDVVLGSRFLRETDRLKIPLVKRHFLKLATSFTRATTGLKITDTHNGLRGLTIKAAGLISITQNRFAFASEILSQIAINKLNYCEVPVTIEYTAYSLAKGQSMLNSS